MKLILKAIILIIIISCFNLKAFALQIISPNEGQIVYQGDKLLVIVKSDPGEQWVEVVLDIYPMSYNIITSEYIEEIVIPRDKIGTIDFNVLAYDNSGNKIKIIQSLCVKMPPNVVLQKVLVADYKTLYKLPQGSSPEEIQRFESRQLRVEGMYSDGIKRKLTSSSRGTTYKSSDEQVVIVSSEGKMTAQGIGEAKVIVVNGNFHSIVDVVVKLYER